MSDWPEEFSFEERIDVFARKQDPGTSHEAAAILTANQKRLSKSVGIVVSILEKYGIQSDFEIRDHWQEFSEEESWSEGLPRMARLWAQRKAMIRQAGQTIHEGRRCRTWEIISGAPALLPEPEPSPALAPS